MWQIDAIEIDFITRFIINLSGIYGLIVIAKIKQSFKNNNLSSVFLFGTGVFLVTFFLHTVEMSMGFAFGLFAVFSMLRYRTESLAVKEMTYLFIIIAMALMTAVSELDYASLAIVVLIILTLAYISELGDSDSNNSEKLIIYEKINYIKPELYSALIEDLKNRTGLDILKADVQDINLLKDTAVIKITYSSRSIETRTPENQTSEN